MSSGREIKTWTPFTGLLVAIMLLGLVATVYRLANGLGASTNLSDAFPWGIWIGIDVLGGVAMAAGGFLIAGAVYIFHLEKYRPIVRPAVLTAFIGYLLESSSLFLDIGQPHRIWHPVVKWQIYSVMWMVAICGILYITVLALEFSPMLFERLGMPGAKKGIQKAMVPIVLFGVLLSTLHQSSLGAVFLIVPGKLSPLWYSAALPFLFLVSAVMMGLSMVSFETIVSSRSFKHPVKTEIFAGLMRASLFVIGFYLVVKIYLLAAGPGLGAAFDGSREANLYLAEMVLGTVLPFLMLFTKKFGRDESGILVVNILVIGGVLLNRLNVGFFGLQRFQGSRGGSYFPSGTEMIVTLAMLALAIFLFKMAAKHLPLLSSAESSREA